MTVQNLWAVPRFVWTHPANRGRRVRALLGAVGWQVYKRTTGRARDLRVWGLTLRCYPDSTSASLVLYCAGRPDWHEMAFMARYLRPGDGFVDVGANIGVYTLFARSLVGPHAPIEAFEPGAVALGRLRENLALNGLAEQVRVHACALAAQPGMVRFSTGRDTTNAIAADSDEPGVEVPSARLDDVLCGAYAMGKMDIEGAEPLALQGAERSLAAANPPVWLLEMNGSCRRYGWPEERIAAWLAGGANRRLAGRARLRPGALRRRIRHAGLLARAVAAPPQRARHRPRPAQRRATTAGQLRIRVASGLPHQRRGDRTPRHPLGGARVIVPDAGRYRRVPPP